MAIKLNLLPTDILISKGLSKALRTFKALTVIFTVILLIFCLGMVGLFIVNKVTLDKAQSDVDNLKAQIKVQETSEQQLILIKDRLSKISTIKSKSDASNNIAGINSLVSDLSAKSRVTEEDASSTKSSLTISLGSNADLSNLIKNIEKTDVFKSVTLSSLGYSGIQGYVVMLDMSAK